MKRKKAGTKKDMIAEIKEEFTRHTTALMEHMTKEVKTVGEGHGTLVNKLNNIESELRSVKMAVVDNSQRLNNVENGLNNVDNRLNKVENGLDNIDKKLDKKLNNHETRITKLEEKVPA